MNLPLTNYNIKNFIVHFPGKLSLMTFVCTIIKKIKTEKSINIIITQI